MKILLTLASAALAVTLVSCSSTPTSRIQKHPELYAPLSDKHKELVSKGRIDRGMTQPAVYLAMGHPDSKFSGQRYGKAHERWNYNVYMPVYTHGFHPYFGYGRGCYGRFGHLGGYYQPSVHYVPRLGASVNFENGKVTGWKTIQRNF